MKSHDEIALEVASNCNFQWYGSSKDLVEFSRRFLAAVAEQSEPVTWHYKEKLPFGFRHHFTAYREEITGDWEPLYLHPPKPDTEVEALREELRARKANDGVQFAGLNGKIDRYRAVMEMAKEALEVACGYALECEPDAPFHTGEQALTALRECLKGDK